MFKNKLIILALALAAFSGCTSDKTHLIDDATVSLLPADAALDFLKQTWPKGKFEPEGMYILRNYLGVGNKLVFYKYGQLNLVHFGRVRDPIKKRILKSRYDYNAESEVYEIRLEADDRMSVVANKLYLLHCESEIMCKKGSTALLSLGVKKEEE